MKRLNDIPDQMYILTIIVLLLVVYTWKGTPEVLRLLDITIAGLLGLLRGRRTSNDLSTPNS